MKKMKSTTPIFPSQLNNLLHKVAKASQAYAKELAKRLAKQPIDALETLIQKQAQKINHVNASIEESYQSVVALCKQGIKGPPIRFDIPSKKIKQAQFQTAITKNRCSEIIEGKAVFTESQGSFKLEVDCVVASSNWHKLGEIPSGTINIMDHLDKLLPVEKCKMSRAERIGLVTFQNGMANKLDDFIESAESVFEHFKEVPLCIGLYNPTIIQSLPSPIDMLRFSNERALNKCAVFSLCKMMKTLADLLPQINPNLFWTHFAHSEAGLIANAALEVCYEEYLFRTTSDYLKDHLITATYGAVKPIPDDYTKHSINTYSKYDIALFFGKDYIDAEIEEMIKSSEPIKKEHKGKTYSIKVVDSKVEPIETIKMPIKMPETLSMKQSLDLSFFEYVAYREEINAAPWGTQVCVNLVNDFAHRIKDHSFAEATYKEELLRNANFFKKKFNYRAC